jgi:hypothetical protein
VITYQFTKAEAHSNQPWESEQTYETKSGKKRSPKYMDNQRTTHCNSGKYSINTWRRKPQTQGDNHQNSKIPVNDRYSFCHNYQTQELTQQTLQEMQQQEFELELKWNTKKRSKNMTLCKE